MISKDLRARASASFITLVAAAALTACGGGSDPEPTRIPENLAITAPASGEAAGALQFGNSSGNAAGLKYSWAFGDGTTSTEAAPSHSYAKGGDYEVVLRVTNEAGDSREVRGQVSIMNKANVKGLVCSGADSSGWCWQQPRPSGNASGNLFFVTPSLGWRTGVYGEIHKTVDGGRSWTPQNTGTTIALRGVVFADDKRGAVLGNGGALLTTKDGGATWTLSKHPSTALEGLRLLPNDTIYVPGANGAYLSSDGGASWTTVAKPTAQSDTGAFWYVDDVTRRVSRSNDGGRTVTPVYDFKAEANAEGFVALTTQLVARGDATALLRTRLARVEPGRSFTTYKEVYHRTVDGGATWSRVESERSADTAPDLQALSSDGQRVISMYYYAYPEYSEDGGRTWTQSRSPAGNFFFSVAVATDGTTIGRTGDEYWLSEDFSKTWTRMATPDGGGLSLRRVGTDTLILGGPGDGVVVTSDKGRTWTTLAPVRLPIYGFDAAFIDAKTGFIVDQGGKLLATSDGGQTWAVRRSDLAPGGGSVQFIGTNGWLVDGDGRLLRSTDRGANWVTDPSTVRYGSVRFTNATLGWARTRSNQLVATKDGGATWTDVAWPVPSFGVADIHQVDANEWVAVGGLGTIAQTKDGGRTWSTVFSHTSDNLYRVTFSAAKTAWAVGDGGTLLRSDDGGANWRKIESARLGYGFRDIGFVDAQRGWIVGEYGLILATTDGGRSWAYQPSNSSVTLSRLHIVDGKTLWVSDREGALLATATGGAR